MAKPDGKEGAAQTVEERRKIAREQKLAKALRDNLRRRKAPGSAESEPTDGGGQ
jgi:hypothetical protein